MYTVRIEADPYLRRWLTIKYPVVCGDAIKLPEQTLLWHTIVATAQRMPPTAVPNSQGDIWVAISEKRAGKDLREYNYHSPRAMRLIKQHLRAEFDYDFIWYVDRRTLYKGATVKDACAEYYFMYELRETMSPHSLLKKYQRYKQRKLKYQQAGTQIEIIDLF